MPDDFHWQVYQILSGPEQWFQQPWVSGGVCKSGKPGQDMSAKSLSLSLDNRFIYKSCVAKTGLKIKELKYTNPARGILDFS